MKAFRKLIIIVLAIALFTALLPVGAYAASKTPFEKAVSSINAAKPKTQGQLSRYSANMKHRITGICNISSLVTLLNRRLAYDGVKSSFTAKKALQANGCTNIVIKGSKCSYTGNTDGWYNRSYSAGGKTYSPVWRGAAAVKQETTRANFYLYLALLLHQHPEGVILRSASAAHVAVVYSFKIASGKVQLYVKDPVGSFSGRLEDSYLYKQSGGDIYGGLDCIVYLDGSKSVSPLRAKNVELLEGQKKNIAPYLGSAHAEYVSSSPSVCSVSSAGKVTGKKGGRASVSVNIKTGAGKTWKYTVSVTVPGSPEIASVKNSGKKKIQVKWSPEDGLTGYEIQYGTSKSFSGAKKLRVKGAGKSSATLSSLKTGKTYYVRIRGYYTKSGSTTYTPWSEARSVKVAQ